MPQAFLPQHYLQLLASGAFGGMPVQNEPLSLKLPSNNNHSGRVQYITLDLSFIDAYNCLSEIGK